MILILTGIASEALHCGIPQRGFRRNAMRPTIAQIFENQVLQFTQIVAIDRSGFVYRNRDAGEPCRSIRSAMFECQGTSTAAPRSRPERKSDSASLARISG
jgi:hypothetical protein